MRSCRGDHHPRVIALAILAPLVVKLLGLPGPNVQNPNLTNAFGSPLGPSWAHPFGVDQLGHDVMSRVIYGARVSLDRGHRRHRDRDPDRRHRGDARRLLPGARRHRSSRASIDLVLSIPPLLLGLGIARRLLGTRLRRRARPARHRRRHLPDRAGHLAVHGPHRPRPGAVAARARVRRGLARLRRLQRPHHVPRDPAQPGRADHRLRDACRCRSTSSSRRPSRSSASAFGRRRSSWGQMIAAATPIFNTAWWFMVFPGAALLITVLAFNLLGDGLRDALNPRYRAMRRIHYQHRRHHRCCPLRRIACRARSGAGLCPRRVRLSSSSSSGAERRAAAAALEHRRLQKPADRVADRRQKGRHAGGAPGNGLRTPRPGHRLLLARLPGRVRHRSGRCTPTSPTQRPNRRPTWPSGPPEISSDNKTVTVHLKEGIHFSPPVNREVTSEDVAYAIERGANPNVANPYFQAYFAVDRRHANGDGRAGQGDRNAEQARRSSST